MTLPPAGRQARDACVDRFQIVGDYKWRIHNEGNRPAGHSLKPQYDAKGNLVRPANYREREFVSAETPRV